MRIACVNQDPGIAPGRQKGAAVHLNAVREVLEARGAEVVPIDERTADDVRARLEGLHAQAPFDLVYERFALDATAGAAFAERTGVPLVVEINAPLSEEASAYRGVRVEDVRASERYVLERASRVLAVSSLVAEYACGLGAPAERVQVLPNGVDRERFAPRTDDGLRDELVPAGCIAIGFHGRLRPWHGFGRLADAVASLLEADLPVHLVTVGKGDFAAQLAGRVPERHVTSVGWVPHEEVGRYVATFDVLPLTYDAEQPCYFSPLKLMEAMSCGVVPVVPDLGDLPEVVRHDVSGLVVPASRPQALTAALRLLTVDPELRDRLAVGAVERSGDFRWDRVADAVFEVVRS